MPEKHLHVELLAHTPEPEKTCALAARTCYSAMEYDELKAQVDEILRESGFDWIIT